MNAFQTIIGTLKPTQQQTAGTGTDSNSQQDSSWLLTSAARAVGSLAGAGNYLFLFALKEFNKKNLMVSFLLKSITRK